PFGGLLLFGGSYPVPACGSRVAGEAMKAYGAISTMEDKDHLHRRMELAEAALEQRYEPFCSVLVGATGQVGAEDHHRAHTDSATRHPEFDLARWAGRHLTAEERREATVYTSGEHCPMCSTAHGVVGLGRIVFASSGKQLQEWHDELGVAPPAARFRPVV